MTGDIDEKEIKVNHEKIPAWLGYIGDHTMQLYRDSHKPLQAALLTNQYSMESRSFLAQVTFFSENLQNDEVMDQKMSIFDRDDIIIFVS